MYALISFPHYYPSIRYSNFIDHKGYPHSYIALEALNPSWKIYAVHQWCRALNKWIIKGMSNLIWPSIINTTN